MTASITCPLSPPLPPPHLTSHVSVPSFFRPFTTQVWALGNIAGDSPVCRDLVLQQGAMGPLLQQLTDRSKLSMLRNATWTLSNFCRGKPQPSFEHVRPALPTLAQLIHSVDEEVTERKCLKKRGFFPLVRCEANLPRREIRCCSDPH